ncbi:T9SS type A sorting domain-containing protein [Marivirga salinae]|uniref:T9SS type A sorting domain-containing protein n=1 Tax=Marivirga salinarum TaxID=3059078 RepID=A0AA51NED0_9BACT|nr:T9SS type A sorting domain-containing protein [Marivirga sp. BDSF4-3]WMN12626.1 T9SS type A sorting domain-containing protein [Marivirga sp. BDSF4-3]
MKLILYVFIMLLLFPICSNAQLRNNGNLRMHLESNIGLFGDFSNNGNFTNNLGTLHVVGSNPQKFNGTNLIHTNNLIINKASNSLQLDNVLQIAGILTFTNGLIQTDHLDITTEFVNFLDGASYTGESNTSHIDGVVRKTGNDAFVFPTGDNSILRPIAITPPASATDHFTSYYTEGNPQEFYSASSLGADLDHISACEYWILNRTGGNSNVAVTLSWDSNSCGVDNLCDLRVSRWDGAQWISGGNGGVSGTEASGTLVSGTNCSVPEPISSFSPFTLGSFSSDNPLPISLISFDAKVCESSVCLSWQTASEINNDFFTVEKSKDGVTWEAFVNLKGAGNSQSVLNYKTIDKSPFSDHSYYRLKQTDFNGEFKYSSIEGVYLENSIAQRLTIYPNPARDNVTIKGLSTELKNIKIYNLMGQEVTSSVMIIKNNITSVELDISLLIQGTYYVKTNNQHNSIIKQ